MRALPEDYMPRKPPSVQDVHAAITARYQFVASPPPAAALGGIITFQGGKYPHPGEEFGIAALILAIDGDAALTTTTHELDLVLEDVGTFLDQQFGFRIKISRKPASYVSVIVVEFDDGLQNIIRPLATMETIINRFRSGQTDAFQLKRIGFGTAAQLQEVALQMAQQVQSLDAFERIEFAIERRLKYPLSANRYYCVAPMSTRDHIQCLEDIEAAVRN